jgi:hypothetical protein
MSDNQVEDEMNLTPATPAEVSMQDSTAQILGAGATANITPPREQVDRQPRRRPFGDIYFNCLHPHRWRDPAPRQH